MTQKPDVPPLEDYVSITDAARDLGISRQAVHKLANRGHFPSLRRVGKNQHPLYVLKQEDVEAWKSKRVAVETG